jgi:hypothetical protein
MFEEPVTIENDENKDEELEAPVNLLLHEP